MRRLYEPAPPKIPCVGLWNPDGKTGMYNAARTRIQIEKGRDPKRCAFFAKFEIDGKSLCRKCAGNYLIERELERENA